MDDGMPEEFSQGTIIQPKTDRYTIVKMCENNQLQQIQIEIEENEENEFNYEDKCAIWIKNKDDGSESELYIIIANDYTVSFANLSSHQVNSKLRK